MIIYLYVKQHNKTKLKYFGKTIKDPYKYNGSGVYWLRHLNKHGTDISTLEVWSFDNQDECTKFAIDFSYKNKIVESSDWANFIIEDGIDNPPSVKGTKQSKEHRQKISKALKGKKKSAIHNEHNRQAQKIVAQRDGWHFRSYATNTTATKWYNNDSQHIRLHEGEQIPEGFKPGRIRTWAYGNRYVKNGRLVKSNKIYQPTQ